MQILVQELPTILGTADEKLFIAVTKAMAQNNSKWEITNIQDKKQENLYGRIFQILEYDVKVNGISVHQKGYFFLKKSWPYLMTIMLTYTSEEEYNEFKSVLSSIHYY